MTEEQNKKRDWLNRPFYAEKKLKALSYKLKHDRELAQQVTAAYGGVDKGKSDSRENGVEALLITLADTEIEYSNYAQECAELRQEVQNAIKTLHDPALESVLEYKFLGFARSFEVIAEETNWSVSTIKTRYKEALDKIVLF